MHPILLKLGPVTIYSFGVFLFLAAVLSVFLIWKQARKSGLSEEKVFDTFLMSSFISLIGARLGYSIGHLNIFGADFSRILLFMHYPGLSFTWALAAGLIAVMVSAFSFGLDVFLILDIFIIAFSWSVLFGFTGCLLDGCLTTNNLKILIVVGLIFAILINRIKRFTQTHAEMAVLSRRHGVFSSAYLIFLSASLLIIPGIARQEDRIFYLALLFISLVLFMVKFPASVLSQIKGYLEQSKNESEKRLKDLKKEDPFEDKGRQIDEASEDDEVHAKTNHERVAALQQQLNLALVQTRKALTKIKLGKYGICESCGKMIDTDRLAVMPTATLCLSCVKKREKK